jgi:subtilisin
MSGFLERLPVVEIVQRARGNVQAAAAALAGAAHSRRAAPYEILRSLGEDGPKLVRMETAIARVLRKYDQELIVEPNWRVSAAVQPRRRVVRKADWAVPAGRHAAAKLGPERRLTIRVRDTAGRSVPGARVLALDAERDEGLAATANHKGVAMLRLPAALGVLPRLYVEPAGPWHGVARYEVGIPAAGTVDITLRPADPADSRDALRGWAAKLPPDGGRGVRIAVVDTGVDTRQPDLAHVATAATDGLADACSVGVPHPHATHVAGVIGARGQAFHGLAPQATLLSMRVTPWGSLNTTALDLGAGIEAAATDGDTHLINVSMTSDGPSSFLAAAAARAFHCGAVCFAAAGNQGRHGIAFPAANKWMLAVSAYADRSAMADDATERNDIGAIVSSLDANLSLARFSNYGPDLDFMAPGVGILSCHADAGYAIASGTSVAAPAITGMAAAIIARDHPDLLTMPKGPARAVALVRVLISRGFDLGFSTNVQGVGMLDV